MGGASGQKCIQPRPARLTRPAPPRPRLAWCSGARIALEVALGLHCLHRNRILHLDLKSLVGEAGLPFLRWFGWWRKEGNPRIVRPEGFDRGRVLRHQPGAPQTQSPPCCPPLLPPQNVLLTESGCAKVADVGLSQVLTSTAAHVSNGAGWDGVGWVGVRLLRH